MKKQKIKQHRSHFLVHSPAKTEKMGVRGSDARRYEAALMRIVLDAIDKAGVELNKFAKTSDDMDSSICQAGIGGFNHHVRRGLIWELERQDKQADKRFLSGTDELDPPTPGEIEVTLLEMLHGVSSKGLEDVDNLVWVEVRDPAGELRGLGSDTTIILSLIHI